MFFFSMEYPGFVDLYGHCQNIQFVSLLSLSAYGLRDFVCKNAF